MAATMRLRLCVAELSEAEDNPDVRVGEDIVLLE
jgi:hypothetical protein